jgi:hypothetical protein
VLDHHSIPGAGTLYKRLLWERAGGYCEALVFRAGSEDWDFRLSAYEVGFKPFHVDEPLYEYRRYPGTMASGLQSVDYKVRKTIYRRHHKLFRQYKKGRQFLSAGYENSSRAAFQKQHYWQSAWLALCGWCLIPQNLKLAKMVKKSLSLKFREIFFRQNS